MTIQEAIKELQVGYLGDTEDLVQAKHIAIKALEKQIPKKPSADSYGERGTGYIVPMCPTCQESVEEGEHHCKCGQSLDWSEV